MLVAKKVTFHKKFNKKLRSCFFTLHKELQKSLFCEFFDRRSDQTHRTHFILFVLNENKNLTPAFLDTGKTFREMFNVFRITTERLNDDISLNTFRS